ncbi:MAG: DnaJ domain-containing protein [Deltaproteobacteria bacterium]|nr:DnaJ domain-containing protein [Deltaproteobacteria bacterium]
MKYQNYYDTLGVDRKASAEEIHKAYRRLARKYHPDLNKAKGSENKFKEINEAHEVLGDPQKRARYDQLGANWQNGQEFQPPPDFEQFFKFGSNFGKQGQSATFNFGNAEQSSGLGGFSDFFNAIFGGSMFSQDKNESEQNNKRFHSHKASPKTAHDISITIAEASRGTMRQIYLRDPDSSEKTYNVKIPAGVSQGSIIRIRPKGKNPQTEIHLRINVVSDDNFSLDGNNINTKLYLTPWEAALGGKVEVKSVDGAYHLTIPAGAQSGQKMRLKGKGLPGKDGSGDLLVELVIQVPKTLSAKEQDLFKQLKEISTYNPRK